ncbi:hypothetical protein GCM10023188_23810 [Pontibacter saemangeumensis]|uniref:DUF3592 domain-containing protein n=1 Tax=Pontibacter saemangeumensis TaxID=1084525 RepID=A0ABP8LRI9_9BACT
MKYIKQFFRDFIALPKHLFFRKYFLLPVNVLFVWITIGNILEMNYGVDDLKKITGKVEYNEVVTTRIINKPLYKGREQELRLKLHNYPEYYRLTDNFFIGEVAGKLMIGDSVTVYYRSWFQTLLGFGRQTDIYQVEYHEKTLFELSDRQRNAKGLALIGAMATLLFFPIYLHYKRNE